MKITDKLRLEWLMLPDSYVGYDAEYSGCGKWNITWYAALRNDKAFQNKRKLRAIDSAVKHWVKTWRKPQRIAKEL